MRCFKINKPLQNEVYSVKSGYTTEELSLTITKMSDGPKEGRLIKSEYINGYKESKFYAHMYTLMQNG